MSTSTEAFNVSQNQKDRKDAPTYYLIGLNNAAISLLVAGDRAGAMGTFKATLELVKQGFVHPQTCYETLERANKRVQMASCQGAATSNRFVVLSSQDHAENAYDMITRRSHVQPVSFNVFLRLDNRSDSTVTRSFACSILLYNFGVAHLQCAIPGPANAQNHQNNPSHGDRLRVFCLQTFQYAESLMPSKSDENLLGRFLLIHTLFTVTSLLHLPLRETYLRILDCIEREFLGNRMPQPLVAGNPAA
jgi:hypothetical protein